MAERKVLHVTYDKGKDDWKVIKEGSDRPLSRNETKKEAVEDARDRIKPDQLAQIKVHKKDGPIQTEWTYGKDPRKYKG
jgi:hypothetical protein